MWFCRCLRNIKIFKIYRADLILKVLLLAKQIFPIARICYYKEPFLNGAILFPTSLSYIVTLKYLDLINIIYYCN